MPTPHAPNLEHPTFAAVKGRFPSAKFKATEFRGCSTLIVSPADLHEVMVYLKNDASTRYDFLSDITAVDYLGYPTKQAGRFGVVYVLRSYEKDEMFIVKTFLDPSLPTEGTAEDPALYLDSVTDLWMGAEWMEREVFDMFGIRFRNHPDLRRILLWETYPAHPLRKDYPLRGRGEREDYRVVDRTDAQQALEGMGVKKFWVRHFEKISAGASLVSVVTAVAMLIAMAVAGDARTGWFETATRYIWPVFALGALLVSIGAAIEAFGLSKKHPSASDHSIPAFLPWWSVGVIAVFPVLLVVFALGGWGTIVFAEGTAAATGGSGVERGRELSGFVPMLVSGSVLTAGFAKVFRITRRDADGDRVLETPSAA